MPKDISFFKTGFIMNSINHYFLNLVRDDPNAGSIIQYLKHSYLRIPNCSLADIECPIKDTPVILKKFIISLENVVSPLTGRV